MLLAAVLAFVAQASPSPAPCTIASARPATIAQIMANPVGYRGRCVAVPGLGTNGLLFSSVEAYYLAGPLIGGDPATNANDRGRLGLDNHRILRRLPEDGLRQITAIGRVQDCETIRNAIDASAAPGEVVMVTGFCHMANGPYLWLSDLRHGPPRRETRLVGEVLRARLGNLVAPPPGWPHGAMVEAAVAGYLQALRTGDRAAFLQLHLGADRGGDATEAVALAFGRHRGFAEIRRAASPQTAIFVESRPGTRDLERTGGDYSATVCFCRSADCAGRWPISTFDADNREDRPYVCTRFGPWLVNRKGELPTFDTGRTNFGLPEPRSNRSTR